MDRLMAAAYLPALRAAAAATLADAEQSGCRIVADDSARLDLTRCDVTAGTVGSG
jgi:hypothetical protein